MMPRNARLAAVLLPLLLFIAPGISPPIRAASQSSSTENPVLRLRDQAEQLYLAGDDLGAEQLFLQLASLPESSERESADALVTAAWLQYLRKQENKALAHLELAIERSASTRIDGDLFDRRFVELFERAQREIVDRRKRAARDLMSVGKEHLEDGDFTAARLSFEDVLGLSPEFDLEARALYSLGVIDLRAGDSEAARLRFEEVLRTEMLPETARLHAGAHSNLGTIFFRQGLWAAAEGAWQQATLIDPESLVAWRNIGLARAEQGDDSGAVAALRTAYRLQPDDPESIQLLARSLQRVGSETEAATVLEMGLGRHPEDARLWLASGSVLRAAGRDGEAVTAFEKAVLLDPINSTGAAERSAVFLSLLATENGRFEDAERWARSALSWDDTTPENWEYLAIALRSQQELEESLTAFQRSVELDPSRPGTVANLGSVLAELGRYSEAETAFDRVIDLDPTNMTATEGLARLRSRQAKEQEESRRAAQPEPVILNERAAAKPISPKKLGVRFVEIDYDRLGLRGALVREVGKRSPAARTGLRRGDLILRVNGYQILDDKDFFRRLKKNPPVEGLEIEILRDAGIDTLFLRLQ